jgi:hypothetical protein
VETEAAFMTITERLLCFGVNYRVKLSHRVMSLLFVSIAVLVVGAPLFWVEGGLTWLQKTVFPPKRPRFMPVNSIWIDAPSLPISWHHGWWFGCRLSSSRATNYCRLVGADGREVYAAEYMPCAGNSPIDETGVRLVTPPDSVDMWLFGEGNDGVIGFLADGDVLLPVAVRNKCASVKSKFYLAPQ